MGRPAVSHTVLASLFWALRTSAAIQASFGRLQVGLLGRGARAVAALERVGRALRWEIRLFASPWARAALVTLAGASLIAIYPLLVSPFLWPQLDYANTRFAGANLFDARHHWVGVIPGQLDFVGDFSTQLRPSEDHKAVFVEHPPRDWWRVLVALEDRYLGTPRSVWGVDVGGLLRALVLDLPRGRMTGGSSLAMQLYRSMQHYRIGPGEPAGVRIRRKLQELAHAPVLTWKLGESGLASWCATHIPLVVAAVPRYGQPVYGIDATARIIFDRPLTDLTLAQHALMAAAVHRPFVILPTTDGWTVEPARLARLARRAQRGLRLAFPASDPDVQAALAELESLEPPRVAIDPGLRSLLPDDPTAAFRSAAQPYRRALYLARGEMIEAIGGLQEQHGRLWREDVGQVHLTFDAVENRRFKADIETALARMQAEWGPRLHVPLMPTARGRQRAQVVVAAADAEGRIVRFYSNSSDVLYGGIQRHRQGGSYQPHREDRPLGSVSKVALALYLGSVGTDPLDTFCNAAVRGFAIRNPDGNRGVVSCRTAGALYTVEQVFARSLNLPLIHALRSHPPEALATVASDVGFNLPPHEAPRVMLTLGRAAAGLQRVHALFHDMLAQLAEEPISPEGPSILQANAALPRPNIAGYLDTTAERDFVDTVLSASVRPGGTLQRLSDFTPQRRRDVVRHIAKTGTSTAGLNVRDLLVAGGIDHRRGRFTYVVLVGSPLPRDGLGRGLSAGDLAPLVRVIFQSLDLASTKS